MGKIGSIIQQETVVESTQTIATSLALQGSTEGVVVTAEEQRAGKGRMGRRWYAKYGDALSMSIILRPEISPVKCPQLTLVAAVAVVQAIEEVTGLRPDIKWPNDILMNGKKLVGILTEMNGSRDKVNFIILGIGVNIHGAKEDFPTEVKDVATSLFAELGHAIDKNQLMECIFFHLENLYRQYIREGFAEIKKSWESYSISIGKEIKARTLQGVIEGNSIGITNDGVLLLKDRTGVIHSIYSADIE